MNILWICQKNYKIETKNEININIFGYKSKHTCPIHLLKENYKDQIELLLLKNKDNLIISTSKVLIVWNTRRKHNETKKMYELFTMF